MKPMRPVGRRKPGLITEGQQSALDAKGILPDSTETKGGHLAVGGCDLVTLAEEHGTPLYVFDEGTIRSFARQYRSALGRGYPGTSTVCYAAKAYCAPWLLRLIADEGLGLDVVSGGELYTALMVNFPADRIYFHGNNKGEDELDFALAMGVRHIVVDNLQEIELLGRLAEARGVRQDVLLRIGPGIETDAHAHLRTGGIDSKFGLGIATGQAEEGVTLALTRSSLNLRGLHMHIGSQISDVNVYRKGIERLFEFSTEMQARYGFDLQEISPGGGFGVRYTPDSDGVDAADMIRQVSELIVRTARSHDIASLFPDLTIEPGRSLVASSAVALYRVGSVKSVTDGRTYVSIDGGMADNMRPSAYGARYTALVANRLDEPPSADVTIAGKYCESGDVLIQHVRLPLPRSGDLLAIPSAGAYQLPMSSNYNMALRPAVVVVSEGKATVVRHRERYGDLLSRDVPVMGDRVPFLPLTMGLGSDPSTGP
jgi:diaminopimelate decarboxylase